jgi:hypothetical protein
MFQMKNDRNGFQADGPPAFSSIMQYPDRAPLIS